jgi:hypothetical protein
VLFARKPKSQSGGANNEDDSIVEVGENHRPVFLGVPFAKNNSMVFKVVVIFDNHIDSVSSGLEVDKLLY